jgi:hypothetical protein
MLPTPDRSREIRVSDADRERYIATLRTHCADGRLSLDEFSDRIERVYSSTSQAELDGVVADLPVAWHSPVRAHNAVETVRNTIRSRKWHVAVFGETVRKGGYRLDTDTAAVAVFGECTLDLSRATFAHHDNRIDAVAVFGEVTVIVPPDVDVTLEGVSIFGEKRLEGDDRSVAGGPTLIVRAVATFGEVRVRRSKPRANESRAR